MKAHDLGITLITALIGIQENDEGIIEDLLKG